jgi:hypothetical protein
MSSETFDVRRSLELICDCPWSFSLPNSNSSSNSVSDRRWEVVDFGVSSAVHCSRFPVHRAQLAKWYVTR